MDDKTIHKYLVSNYMPLMIGVIRKMKNKGSLPKEMSDLGLEELFSDLYEPAVHGLMKSIHTYDPNKISSKTGEKKGFTSHAWSTISGIISDHLKHRNIPQADITLARMHQKKPEEKTNQTVGIRTKGIGRDVTEHLGGSSGAEGEESTGATIIRNPEQEFANRLSSEARNILQTKVDKAKARIEEKTPTQSSVESVPEVQPKVDTKTTQIQKPKMIIRRMANPEQVERMDRVDSAKSMMKKPE